MPPVLDTPMQARPIPGLHLVVPMSPAMTPSAEGKIYFGSAIRHRMVEHYAIGEAQQSQTAPNVCPIRAVAAFTATSIGKTLPVGR